ncbi:hypothetical protein ABFA07_005778 [Porites harrisoni]
MAVADQEAAARKSSLATQRGFSSGVRLVKGFRWMEHFSNVGFLRGSSADTTTIPCLLPIFYRSRQEEGIVHLPFVKKERERHHPQTSSFLKTKPH